jgi:hypothetical protein
VGFTGNFRFNMKAELWVASSVEGAGLSSRSFSPEIVELSTRVAETKRALLACGQ